MCGSHTMSMSMLTFIRDLMAFLPLLVGVVTLLVVLGVADTLGNFTAVVLVFRLVTKVFVEFFYFAFFY